MGGGLPGAWRSQVRCECGDVPGVSDAMFRHVYTGCRCVQSMIPSPNASTQKRRADSWSTHTDRRKSTTSRQHKHTLLITSTPSSTLGLLNLLRRRFRGALRSSSNLMLTALGLTHSPTRVTRHHPQRTHGELRNSRRPYSVPPLMTTRSVAAPRPRGEVVLAPS